MNIGPGLAFQYIRLVEASLIGNMFYKKKNVSIVSHKNFVTHVKKVVNYISAH